MTRRIDWDAVARKQRAQLHGSQGAFDELPPAGSYADQVRFLSSKSQDLPSFRENRYKPQEKLKPPRDQRLKNIRNTLLSLLAVTKKPQWSAQGPNYRRKMLKQMRGTLKSLLTLEPSASNESLALETTQFLEQHGVPIHSMQCL